MGPFGSFWGWPPRLGQRPCGVSVIKMLDGRGRWDGGGPTASGGDSAGRHRALMTQPSELRASSSLEQLEEFPCDTVVNAVHKVLELLDAGFGGILLGVHPGIASCAHRNKGRRHRRPSASVQRAIIYLCASAGARATLLRGGAGDSRGVRVLCQVSG